MKAWFVYLINGKQIGTWANNTTEARENLVREYGDVAMEYVGNTCHNSKVNVDDVTYVGMSPVDVMIATGMTDLFVGLRYA